MLLLYKLSLMWLGRSMLLGRPRTPSEWSCRYQPKWWAMNRLKAQIGRLMESDMLPLIIWEGDLGSETGSCLGTFLSVSRSPACLTMGRLGSKSRDGVYHHLGKLQKLYHPRGVSCCAVHHGACVGGVADEPRAGGPSCQDTPS